jgi:hypothetical protein
MGSIATLKLDGYDFLEMKNAVEPMALSCFQDRDLSVTDGSTSRWRNDLERVATDVIAIYTVSRADAIARLEVLGFTLDEAEQEYRRGRDNYLSDNYWWHEEEAPEERSAVAKLTLKDYIEFLGVLYKNGVTIWDDEALRTLPSTVSEVTQLFDPDEYFFSFPSHDVRWVIRLLLEVADGARQLQLDISELVNSGWIEDPATLCQETRQKIIVEHSRAVPTLVLTEGPTDSEFLGSALQIIYPHLVDYFSFLDFGMLKLQGGAPELVKSLKAFSTAGISNRIVAIFDSDAAALDALSALDRAKLPANVKVLTYPPIKLTKEYPTLGPTGEVVFMDISDTAASIELYFGEDVLRDADSNELAPVRWTSYIKGQKKYQGEIEGKGNLQKRFRAKLDEARQAPSSEATVGLDDMKAIINCIVRAFSNDAA